MLSQPSPLLFHLIYFFPILSIPSIYLVLPHQKAHLPLLFFFCDLHNIFHILPNIYFLSQVVVFDAWYETLISSFIFVFPNSCHDYVVSRFLSCLVLIERLPF